MKILVVETDRETGQHKAWFEGREDVKVVTEHSIHEAVYQLLMWAQSDDNVQIDAPVNISEIK